MNEVRKQTQWLVTNGENKDDKRVFIIRSKEPIHMHEAEACLNRWTRENLTYPSSVPEKIEIDYEKWRP